MAYYFDNSSIIIINILVEYIFSLYHAGVAAKIKRLVVIDLVKYFSSLLFLSECIVRSLGPTATSSMESSLVRGVHHAGVAVKLMHFKEKYKILVYIFNKRLVYNIFQWLVLNFKIKKLPEHKLFLVVGVF